GPQARPDGRPRGRCLRPEARAAAGRPEEGRQGFGPRQGQGPDAGAIRRSPGGRDQAASRAARRLEAHHAGSGRQDPRPDPARPHPLVERGSPAQGVTRPPGREFLPTMAARVRRGLSAAASLALVAAGAILTGPVAQAAVGDVTEYAIPTPSSFPFGIASGRDGNVWFTEDI